MHCMYCLCIFFIDLFIYLYMPVYICVLIAELLLPFSDPLFQVVFHPTIGCGVLHLPEVDYLEFCNLLGRCPKRDPMMLAAMTRWGSLDYDRAGRHQWSKLPTFVCRVPKVGPECSWTSTKAAFFLCLYYSLFPQVAPWYLGCWQQPSARWSTATYDLFSYSCCLNDNS